MNTTALKDDGNERNCLDNFSVRSCGGPMGSPLSPSLKGGACAASTAKVKSPNTLTPWQYQEIEDCWRKKEEVGLLLVGYNGKLFVFGLEQVWDGDKSELRGIDSGDLKYLRPGEKLKMFGGLPR